MDDQYGNLRPIDAQLAKDLEGSRIGIEDLNRISMQKLHDSVTSLIPSVFVVGEELEIKNSTFRIETLGKKYMKLKLLPRCGECETEVK